MSEPEDDWVSVEVVYARPDVQRLLSVRVRRGTVLREVVRQSGIADQFPEIELETAPMGIFGRVADPEQPVREHDRIELYRPLENDPKTLRAERARRQRGR